MSKVRQTASRTHKLLQFDYDYRDSFGGPVCGVDEAGRGPLAGPVVAAAVIFSDDVFIDGVFDSKQLSYKKRCELYDEIISNALSWSIGVVDNIKIDEINILNATKEAMNIAINSIQQLPKVIIADGNFYSNNSAEVFNVIKADALSFSVAAASIIAKVTRDRIMCEFENQYPNFSFSHHKGYGTAEHIDEIMEFGYTPIHRRSFRLKNYEQLTLEI
ncbi:MAG: ribonuclease HII [Ignavibacteria bacterium]|nr:ribonuclease HII [Ignavibacteria bacterium]